MKTIRRPSYTATTPRVTVVVPCYNYGHYLPRAIDSALDQEGVRSDVVVVDDCSTDGSLRVALELAAKDERIRVISQNPNRGHIQTYNHGLSEATGDYVVLLSADDMLAPGSLLRSTSLMEAHPSVGLVYGYAPAFRDVPQLSSMSRESWSVWKGIEWMTHMSRRGHNIIVNPEAILRKSIMDQLVGYREDMPQAADMELWLRAASICDVGRVNGPEQAFYRLHANNMHRTSMDGVIREAQARRDVFLSLLQNQELPPETRKVLVRRATEKMSRDLVHEARKVHGRHSTEPQKLVDELLDLAVKCDPSIARSVSWRILNLRRRRNMPKVVTYLEDVLHRAVWSLRWRRWRRWGI